MVTRLLPFMETTIFVSSWYTYSIILSLWTIPQLHRCMEMCQPCQPTGNPHNYTLLGASSHGSFRWVSSPVISGRLAPHKNPIEITSVVGPTYDSWDEPPSTLTRYYFFRPPLAHRWRLTAANSHRQKILTEIRWRWAPKLNWSCCPKHFFLKSQ